MHKTLLLKSALSSVVALSIITSIQFMGLAQSGCARTKAAVIYQLNPDTGEVALADSTPAATRDALNFFRVRPLLNRTNPLDLDLSTAQGILNFQWVYKRFDPDKSVAGDEYLTGFALRVFKIRVWLYRMVIWSGLTRQAPASGQTQATWAFCIWAWRAASKEPSNLPLVWSSTMGADSLETANLQLYTLAGEKVAEQVFAPRAGHGLLLDELQLASGVYFYVLTGRDRNGVLVRKVGRYVVQR